MSKLKIAVIISSTRPTRFGEKPAQWILDKANERPEIEAEIVDLRDFNLPFFDEMASNAWMPSQNAEAVRWQNKISEFDGYIFVVAEYNRAITGALKNALDQAYVNWNKKAFGAVGYGTVGGARAIENLRPPTLAEPRRDLFSAPVYTPGPAVEPDELDLARARAVVLENLGPSPVTIDELVRGCQLSAPVVLTVVLELELAGRVQRLPGHQVSLA